MLSFFKFPRELRDAIYRQYVTFEGGYVLNPETNRMRGAVNDLPVDLALMYTCKRVAEEMKGLPLKANTLTFSTFYPPEHRVHAGFRFNDEFGRLCDNAGQSPMDIARLIDYSPAPWAIPTQQEVEEMLWLLYGTHTFEEDASYGLWDNDSNPGLSKFRYSAVAVAIRFLESVTPAHRAQIRHIKLMEDLALWIMEALALGPAGMPSGSFTLVLDGDGDTRCSEIFQTVVLRDAAWQEAMDECYSRGILPPQPWAKRRQNPRSRGDGPGGVAYEKAANHSYLYEGFPQAIRDIVNGTSVVRCNFDPGEYEDVEQLIETRKTWTLAEWKGKWYERVTKSFEPSPPLPSWKDILREFLLE
ncbi:hypothetical protein CH35J_001192 [Colletotrichum higginsianum]|uniref:Uncharacterized protein n=1 Tax=Colletotrichum higginsianum TaxID=80884 RepID=A0A4T0WLD0_9PEZI|nr:hypothetical protein CH35J_001192 [Colletotrichum higginsianum]